MLYRTAATSTLRAGKASSSFLKKRTKKLLLIGRPAWASLRAYGQKLLLLFSKRSASCSCLGQYSAADRGVALAGLVCLLGTLGTSVASAQPHGQVGAGHEMARTWCSACHVVGPEQISGGAVGVPSFRSIAAMKSTTTMSLSAFLQTTHSQMPNFQLARSQIADVAAYILSLRIEEPPT